MQGLKKVTTRLATIGATLMASTQAMAAYTYNFPEPVTPIAKETLHVHNLFMIIILVIFFGVLAIMLYSFWAHRKSQGHQAAGFVAPGGRFRYGPLITQSKCTKTPRRMPTW